MGKIKIFLSYHKDSPVYKTDVFQPIHVGAALTDSQLPFAIADNSGENISELNPYYCELTGHYWVLKNYLNTCDEEYIGFAHYRRLLDFTNITKEDIPSIYGMKYSESLKFFERLNNINIYDMCKEYDIICPCTCYMYKNTVNPELRENEPHFNVYDHFKEEHNNNCLDALKLVIDKYYPEYSISLSECYNMEKSYFYNIYVMKKEILTEFLTWEFDILNKIEAELKTLNKDYKRDNYKRMAGFVGECLINVWLLKNNNYKIGHIPIYMIDFEADYIEKINQFYTEGKYNEALDQLTTLFEISSDKFSVLHSLVAVCILLKNEELLEKYFDLAEIYAKTPEEYYTVIRLYIESDMNNPETTCNLFEKLFILFPKEKIYARAYLTYTENLHDIDKTEKAWLHLKEFELDNEETEKYATFLKTYEMIKRCQ